MAASRTRNFRSARSYDVIPPERNGAPRSTAWTRRAPDISDAVFHVIAADAQPLRDGAATNRSEKRDTASKPSSKSTFFSRRLSALERQLQAVSPVLFSIIVMGCMMLAFVGFGRGFSSPSRQSATPLQTLVFSNVTLTPRHADGMPILVLNGMIENKTGRTEHVAPIEAALTVDGRQAGRISIMPPVSVMKEGERQGFTARIRYDGGSLPRVALTFRGEDA